MLVSEHYLQKFSRFGSRSLLEKLPKVTNVWAKNNIFLVNFGHFRKICFKNVASNGLFGSKFLGIFIIGDFSFLEKLNLVPDKIKSY